MKFLTTKDMTFCALLCAVICILAPITFAIGPVPITLATFSIYLSATITGAKRSFISTLVYLLLGLAGLPVFSGGAGGFSKFAGPTGGYLIGYLFIALIGGLFADKTTKSYLIIIGMIIATAVLYIFGTAWFIKLAACDLKYALSVCVLPFLLPDLLKILLAVLAGSMIKRALIKNELL